MSTHPSRLGPFALEERCAASGACSTFRAVHVVRRVSVAIRLLPHGSLETEIARNAFIEDIDDLKALDDPHGVRCLGASVESGWPYIVFEWVRGESLARRLDRIAKLPWEAAVDIALATCRALEDAHARGVLHGRVSPTKILIDEEKGARLAGFATVRVERYEGRSHLDLLPTEAAYLAPEQWRAPPLVTPRTDVHAVGCLLFEMLTGHPPRAATTLDGGSPLDVGARLRTVSSLELTCPVWLDVLVERLLAEAPNDRVASAREVADALEEARRHMASGMGTAQRAIVRGKTSLTRGDDQDELQRIRRRRVRRRRQGPFYEQPLFLAICLAAIVAVGAWAVWPMGESALFENAQGLMASEDLSDRIRARDDYLIPLIERFPDSGHRTEARDFIRQVAMDQAFNRMKLNKRLDRKPSSDGERRFAQGWEFEQIDDQLAAVTCYRALVDELSKSANTDDQTFVLLAEKRADAIVASQPGGEAAFVERHLARGNELADVVGDRRSAERIWEKIITLYDGDKRFQRAVAQAASRLRNGASGP